MKESEEEKAGGEGEGAKYQVDGHVRNKSKEERDK
jgi:hypothetical protein